MWTIVRAICTIWQFLFMFVVWILAWLLQILTIAVTYPITDIYQRRFLCARIFRHLNTLVMDRLHPLWWVTVLKGLPHEQLKGQKYIAMCNHLSNADPFLLCRLIVSSDRDWKFVSKGSLFSVPFGGWCMSNQGDLAVKFTKEKGGWGTEKGSVKVLFDTSIDAVEHGDAVAVFPEGVRNPEPKGPLGEFKAGYFDLAVQQGYKILPIAISGSETCWPVHDWRFDAAKVYLTVGDLVDPAGMTSDALKQRVAEKITEMRDSHPDRKRSN